MMMMCYVDAAAAVVADLKPPSYLHPVAELSARTARTARTANSIGCTTVYVALQSRFDGCDKGAELQHAILVDYLEIFIIVLKIFFIIRHPLLCQNWRLVLGQTSRSL
jgi:hypothetical protein